MTSRLPSALFARAVILSSLAITRVASAEAPARGCLDARWSSGYVLRGHGHHPCGYFAVCPGCSGLVPQQYRAMTEALSTGSGGGRVGFSWYAGESWGVDPSWHAEPSWHADGHPAATELPAVAQ